MAVLILLPLFLPTYILAWLIYTRFFHPLRNIPGPFLASLTRFWCVRQLTSGSFDKTQRRLHAQHGPLVRLAPDEIACADPAAIKVIYGIQRVFWKTDFYAPWNTMKAKYPGHFAQMDEKTHGERRRIVNNVYSMSSVLQSEVYVDRCSELFVGKMAGKADKGEVVDLGRWLQMYAFDVLGELFFGAMFGFMEQETDANNYIESLDAVMPVIATASVCPSAIQKYILPIAKLLPATRKALPSLGHIKASAVKSVEDRQRDMEKGKELRRDILARLFEIEREKGEKVDFHAESIQQESYSALFAGSDTTAIALRSVFYYLMRHPLAYEKLMDEIDQATANGALSDPVKYAEAIKLPYFCAVVKEAMRLHPSVALTMPRYVPPGGVQLAGQFIPEGYRVGINGAVVHYDKGVFGEDADSFNPDRWLERDGAMMDKYMIPFGAGTRTCIGKNISLSEMHKMIPQFLRVCKVELVNPEKEWTTHDYWFNTQRGLDVTIKRREKSR